MGFCMEEQQSKTVRDYLIEGGVKGRIFRRGHWSEEIAYEILDIRQDPNGTGRINCEIEYREKRVVNRHEVWSTTKKRGYMDLSNLLYDKEFVGEVQ